MISPMITIPQTILTVFYAIIWGMIANVQPRWIAFDWARFSESRVRARIYRSVVFFNAVPIVYFAAMFLLFGGPTWKSVEANIFGLVKIIASIAPAFALFGFYRLWLAIIEDNTEAFYWRDNHGFVPYPGADLIRIEADDERRREQSAMNLTVGLFYIFTATAIPVIASGWIAWGNLIGLTCGFLGTILLLGFSVSITGGTGPVDWDTIAPRWRWYLRGGAVLLAIGFLLQLIAALFSGDFLR